MKELVEEKLNDKETAHMKVFINLDSILNNFYSPRINEGIRYLDDEDKFILSSELINIVAHYRHFFWSRYGVQTSFFVYNSNKKPLYSMSVNEEFKAKYWERRSFSNIEFKSLNSMIKKNMELVYIISPYLPNAYFIDTGDMEPSLIPFIFIRNNLDLSLILTNDIAEYQLANYTNFGDETFIMTLKGDDSEILSRNDIMNQFLKASKKGGETTLSSNFYVPVLAISGYKPYNLKGKAGIGVIKAVRMLEKALKDGSVVDTPFRTIDPILDVLGFGEADNELIRNNFKILSIENVFDHVLPKQIDNIKGQIIDKRDVNSLFELNSTYYQKYPIMIFDVFDGEL